MKDWLRKKRERDPYREKARKLGIRSRAYFKLMDIDRRYGIFRNGDIVIDLGAYPGGWLQYISEKIGIDGRVIGVDIKEIKDFIDRPNISTVKGDVFDKETMDKLNEILGGEKADVVVSDLSPNITGIWELDTERIYDYNMRVLNYIDKYLKRGGRAVIKSFEGRYSSRIIKRIRERFRWVGSYKPKASRKRSAEFYIIGMDYLGKPRRRSRKSDNEQSVFNP